MIRFEVQRVVRSGRSRMRFAAVALAFSALLTGVGAAPAAAHNNDSRITASDPHRCFRDELTIDKPIIRGNSAQPEVVYWLPLLYRFTGYDAAGNVTLALVDYPRDNNGGFYWRNFSTNNTNFGSVGTPMMWTFRTTLSTGWYIVQHYAFWTTTGEYGNKFSGWCQVA